LRWILGVLVVFGLGFLSAIFFIYSPQRARLLRIINDNQAAYQQGIESAQNQIAELKAERDQLLVVQEANETLKAENDALLSEQSQNQLHIALLQARLDVLQAELALSDADPARASIVLERTSDILQRVADLLPDDQRATVDFLQKRLVLVLNELESDPDVARADLNVLAQRLLEIESSLLKSP
jgi:hypothetical protein